MFCKDDDLRRNPATRVAICLCLDSSGAMAGKKLDELNRGIREFYAAIRKDRIALSSVEVCVVTFGSEVKTLNDFTTLDCQGNCQIDQVRGNALLGEGVNLALQKLEDRKMQYKSAGVEYYQPWLVIMSGGAPDSSSPVDEAAARTTDLEEKKKLSVFSIGIGDNADMEVLNKFSKKRPALKLQGVKFCEFFGWLSTSISTVSVSQPSDMEVPNYDWDAL